jgi:hypothetical protein
MKSIVGGLAALVVAGGIAAAAPAQATGVNIGDPCPHAQNNLVIQARDGTRMRCVSGPGGYIWVLDTGVPGPDHPNGGARPGDVCGPNGDGSCD